MGQRASVITLYGICYPADSEGAAKIQDGDESHREGSPAWMASNLYREARDGVEVIPFGYYDYPGYALALEDSADYGDDWLPLEIGGDPHLGDRRHGDGQAALKAFCEKHGLPWEEPKWWAVPYYG